MMKRLSTTDQEGHKQLDIRRASNGETFNITEDLWKLSATGENAAFNFGWCNTALSEVMKLELKEAVAQMLKRDSVGHARTSFSAVKRFSEWLSLQSGEPVKKITCNCVIKYLRTAPSTMDHHIKYLTDRWIELGLSGVSQQAADRLTLVQQAKSDQLHILTLDPEKGPHLEDEIAMVDRSLHELYETGKINDAKYILVQIFRLYGQRTSMVANLKLGDVRTPRHHGEETSLRFEVMKQSKNQPRRHGPKRPAPMLFTFALENYLDQITQGTACAKWDLEAPLFPANTTLFGFSTKQIHLNRALNSTSQTASGYRGHTRTRVIYSRYITILQKLEIVSPRTGKAMVFNPMRDRHTIATIMAIRGCTAEEIASWLHHSNTNSCQAYIEIAWQHHQLMSSLLDGKLTHVAGQFLGEVIKDDLDTFASQSLIAATDIDDVPNLGACASNGCAALENLAAPFACFLCRNFNLSIDADLDPLLRLLAERKSEAKRHGDDEYGRSLNRHIAAILAAQRTQDAARAAISSR